MIITVYGCPAPQGSKRHVGHGILIESSKKVKPWREAVLWAAREIHKGPRLLGPIELRICFTLPRPKSAKANALPDKRPDLSKLIRSTEDALTDAGIWEDDSRVVKVTAWKAYPVYSVMEQTIFAIGPLDVPGAVIEVKPYLSICDSDDEGAFPIYRHPKAEAR